MTTEQTSGGQAFKTLPVRFVAGGEVRNAAGEVVDRPVAETTQHVPFTLEQIRAAVERNDMTDDRLREIGFTDHDIDEIRSTTP